MLIGFYRSQYHRNTSCTREHFGAHETQVRSWGPMPFTAEGSAHGAGRD